MAWRPTQYLLEGELDNTTPGRVTGWMRFAGMKEKVTFELEGNFHRDIRGAKIRFTGDGHTEDPEATSYMSHFAEHQTGDVGDITSGLPPSDYAVGYPYVEVYSDQNGRIVVELEPEQLAVIGTPIPACESDPVSRDEQNRNMADFLAGLSQEAGVPAVAPAQQLVSDPSFTYWVISDGRIIGEARDVEPRQNGVHFAYVRLFAAPELAEYGTIEPKDLRLKTDHV